MFDLDIPEQSDPKELTALQVFKAIVTQTVIEQLADEIYIFQRPAEDDLLNLLSNLSSQFGQSSLFDTSVDTGIKYIARSAIRNRDSELLLMLADYHHRPETVENNPRFLAKIQAIANGDSPPALRVV